MWESVHRTIVVVGFCLAAFFDGAAAELRWERLPALPDRFGFAGAFAGVSHGALIVAGGANFPEKPPWEGGMKKWHDSVFVLEGPGSEWSSMDKLPMPLGYGASVTIESGILFIGGSDEKRHYADVRLVSWRNRKIQFESWPPLPRPIANLCSAICDDVIYVAGGIESPESDGALRVFLALDLRSPKSGWRELEPWPGPGRMFAVAASGDGQFFIFGGAGLKRNADGKTVRESLRDGYAFGPKEGWKRITDLPRAIVAAPSPAIHSGAREFLIPGGDDGTQVEVAPDKHRGFSRQALVYEIDSDRWIEAGQVPFALVTTPSVDWNGGIVIPGGEIRPGVRSTEVWIGRK